MLCYFILFYVMLCLYVCMYVCMYVCKGTPMNQPVQRDDVGVLNRVQLTFGFLSKFRNWNIGQQPTTMAYDTYGMQYDTTAEY